MSEYNLTIFDLEEGKEYNSNENSGEYRKRNNWLDYRNANDDINDWGAIDDISKQERFREIKPRKKKLYVCFC